MALAALIREKPVDVPVVLIGLAFLVLMVGQLWAILVILLGGASAGVRLLRTKEWPQITLRGVFTILGGWISVALVGLAFSGWLLAMTTAFAPGGLAQGNPDGSRPGCSYALNNHGEVTCVSQQEYEQVGASGQQFGAGVLISLYAFQSAVTLAALRVKRAPRS
ncbi:MAG: hypothetical protein R2734_10600 [Nocardioides sp.]